MLKWISVGIFLLLFVLVILVFINSVYHQPLASEQNVDISFASTPILFVSDRDGNDEVYVTDQTRQQGIRLTSNKQKDFLPTLAPKQEEFVYYSEEDGAYLLRLCTFSPFDCEPVTYTRNYPKSILFSPDGLKLLVEEEEENSDSLWVISLAQVRAELVTQTVDFAAWSYDSKTVFYHQGDPVNEIWIRTFGSDSRLGDPYLVAAKAAAPWSDAGIRGLLFIDFSLASPVLVKSSLRGENKEILMDLPDLKKIDKIRLTGIAGSSNMLLASFGMNTSLSLINLSERKIATLPSQGREIKYLGPDSLLFEQDDQLGNSQIWIEDMGIARQLTKQANNWLSR